MHENLRSRRRKLRILAVCSIVALFGTFTYLLHRVTYLPQYTVSAINVMGVQAISPEDIKQYVDSVIYDGSKHFFSRANIFFYPRAVIENDLVADFPRIKSVHVSRQSMLAQALTVTVDERKAYAQWCPSTELGTGGGDGECFQMDESGFIFANADASTTRTSPYTFRGGLEVGEPIGQTYAGAQLPGILVLLKLLGQSGMVALGANVETESDYSVPMQSGYVVKVSFGEDVTAIAKNLELILTSAPIRDNENKLEYIDMRFGNRVYYKMKGQEAVANTQ